MMFFLAALAFLALVGVLFFGAGILRSVLSKDHPLQAVLSEEVVSSAITWLWKNWRMLFGCALMAAFVVITIIYS